MFNLEFKENQNRQIAVHVKVGASVVATGLVFLGDTAGETHCAVSVQRFHLLEEAMVTALRHALVGLMGDEARVDSSIDHLLQAA